MNIVAHVGPYIVNKTAYSEYEVYLMYTDTHLGAMISSSSFYNPKISGNRLAAYNNLDKALRDINLRQETNLKLEELNKQIEDLNK